MIHIFVFWRLLRVAATPSCSSCPTSEPADAATGERCGTGPAAGGILALKTGDAFLVPGVFGIATALPVIVVSVLLVRGVDQAARLMQRAQAVDYWVKKGVAAVFIGIGIYSIATVWLF